MDRKRNIVGDILGESSKNNIDDEDIDKIFESMKEHLPPEVLVRVGLSIEKLQYKEDYIGFMSNQKDKMEQLEEFIAKTQKLIISGQKRVDTMEGVMVDAKKQLAWHLEIQRKHNNK